jgi:hypothetical protein
MTEAGSSMIEPTTCQAFYDDDRQRLAEEIVEALQAQAQGCRVTRNATGEHCVAGFVNIAKLAQALKRVVVEVTMMD